MEDKTKFTVTNKLNQSVKLGNILFLANETKVLDEEPSSDKFIVEKMTQEKKTIKLKENKK